VQRFWLTCDANAKAVLLKHTQHRNIVGKNFRSERFKSGPAANAGEMPHQDCPEAQALVFVDDGERDLRWPGSCIT
jgi:hypothetical protein